MMSDVYAFDDCTILHFCELRPSKPFHQFVGESIRHKCHHKLQVLLNHLRQNNLPRCRFVPEEDFDANIIKSYNQLLEGVGNVQMLKAVFKKEMIDQLQTFYKELKKEFTEIEKDDNITMVKELFVKNERPLKKGWSIPNDDDLKIIAGYSQFYCHGEKYLISHDEDFWGNKDLILQEFQIIIIEEWNCHKLAS